tara:strand:- start:654 stop:887 length:234 start_codon:yes stop_codon:yes gene_type:complete
VNKSEKWDRGRTLLLESLYKPDSKLRGCAYNQGCYDEMMSLRDQAIEHVKSLSNPHQSNINLTSESIYDMGAEGYGI